MEFKIGQKVKCIDDKGRLSSKSKLDCITKNKIYVIDSEIKMKDGSNYIRFIGDTRRIAECFADRFIPAEIKKIQFKDLLGEE